MNKLEAALAWAKLPNDLMNQEQREICDKTEEILNPGYSNQTGTICAEFLAEEVEKLRAREKFLAEALCGIARFGAYAASPENIPNEFQFRQIANGALNRWRDMVQEDNK